MAAALMSKSFAGVSLRSAVPTKGQVRHRLLLLLAAGARAPLLLHNKGYNLQCYNHSPVRMLGNSAASRV